MSRSDAEALSAAFGGGVSHQSAVSEVTRLLLDHFTSGNIEPGTRLPPERQLAASMGVGRSAIREALAALEVLGVVNVRPGSGTYLRGTVSELLPQTLSWGMLLGAPKTRELVGVRHGLEVQVARIAATRINEDELGRLRRHLDTMEANRSSFGDFVTADMHFHQVIADVAGNVLLSEMLQSVRSLLRVWVERARNDSDHASTTCREHDEVLEALRSGNSEACAEAMSRHMDSAGYRLVRSL